MRQGLMTSMCSDDWAGPGHAISRRSRRSIVAADKDEIALRNLYSSPFTWPSTGSRRRVSRASGAPRESLKRTWSIMSRARGVLAGRAAAEIDGAGTGPRGGRALQRHEGPGKLVPSAERRTAAACGQALAEPALQPLDVQAYGGSCPGPVAVGAAWDNYSCRQQESLHDLDVEGSLASTCSPISSGSTLMRSKPCR